MFLGFTFSPAIHSAALSGKTIEQETGAFFYQEVHWRRFAIHGSIRCDFQVIDPEEERESFYVGRIRERSFSDFSAAQSPHLQIGSLYIIGVHVSRTFRAPTAQERFSEGPHLTAYSYVIGSAEPGQENNVGSEL